MILKFTRKKKNTHKFVKQNLLFFSQWCLPLFVMLRPLGSSCAPSLGTTEVASSMIRRYVSAKRKPAYGRISAFISHNYTLNHYGWIATQHR